MMQISFYMLVEDIWYIFSSAQKRQSLVLDSLKSKRNAKSLSPPKEQKRTNKDKPKSPIY